MNTQKKLQSAAYVARKLNADHEWGKDDCCTVFLEWYDYIWGAQEAVAVLEKYNSKRGAIRFYKEMKLSWRQWLFLHKFEQTDEPQEGDVAVLDHKLYPTVYIIHNGAGWYMDEERGYTGVALGALELHEDVTFWRHK